MTKHLLQYFRFRIQQRQRLVDEYSSEDPIKGYSPCASSHAWILLRTASDLKFDTIKVVLGLLEEYISRFHSQIQSAADCIWEEIDAPAPNKTA